MLSFQNDFNKVFNFLLQFGYVLYDRKHILSILESSGLILESIGMRAIFQKEGKKGQKIVKKGKKGQNI